MEFNKDTLEWLFTKFGPWGAFIVVVILIFLNPDSVEKWRSIISKPAYRFFRWGSRMHIASTVAYHTTSFLKEHVVKFLPSVHDFSLKIMWVESPRDPVLLEEGIIILRLRETDDQARNIMSAAKVALPRLICPTIRTYLDPHASSAIDLTILRALAGRLGKHAYPIFLQHFYEPATINDAKVADLYSELIELDRTNIFVPIFIDEIGSLGDTLFASGKSENVTKEIYEFLSFLLKIARREVREEVKMVFHSPHINISIILLAISFRAQTEGTEPYLNRINKNINAGCESIYILGYEAAKSFMCRVVNIAKEDRRLTLVKHHEFSSSVLPETNEFTCISLLHVNSIYASSSFKQIVETRELNVGSLVMGLVRDVSQDKSVVDIGGVNATITKSELSWSFVDSCDEQISEGQNLEFFVSEIDLMRERISLTRRFPQDDPFVHKILPSEGDSIDVTILRLDREKYYVCRTANDLEVFLPLDEVSWFSLIPESPEKLIGSIASVVVYAKDIDSHQILCSIRQKIDDPWPEIHRAHPCGTELTARVVKVEEDAVRVELPGGLHGIIHKESFEAAGYEYVDHQNNVVKGQGLEVVVSKVFIQQRRIRLDLKRSVDAKRLGTKIP